MEKANENCCRHGLDGSSPTLPAWSIETQEQQDRWLLENREAINAKIRRGIMQLDRGEGIPEDELDAHLTRLKSHPE